MVKNLSQMVETYFRRPFENIVRSITPHSHAVNALTAARLATVDKILDVIKNPKFTTSNDGEGKPLKEALDALEEIATKEQAWEAVQPLLDLMRSRGVIITGYGQGWLSRLWNTATQGHRFHVLSISRLR